MNQLMINKLVRSLFVISVFIIPSLVIVPTTSAAPSISNISTNSNTIPKYEKFEITFDVTGSAAGNPQFPYNPSPPPGIDPTNPKHQGISVDAVFTNPNGQTFQQPAFIYQNYQSINNNSGYFPTGNKVWKVRFAPDIPGTWTFQLKAQDASGLSPLTTKQSFTVTDSAKRGFIRVSETDPRYFEFSNGEYFPAIGRHATTTYDQPGSGDTSSYTKFGQNGITLIRDWMSGFYGSAWLEWRDGRNIYDFYLPRAGLEGLALNGKEYLTMVLADSDWTANSWYNTCRRQDPSAPHTIAALKPNTTYKISSTYHGQGIAGPVGTNFGYIVKLGVNGAWNDNCGSPDGLYKATT